MKTFKNIFGFIAALIVSIFVGTGPAVTLAVAQQSANIPAYNKVLISVTPKDARGKTVQIDGAISCVAAKAGVVEIRQAGALACEAVWLTGEDSTAITITADADRGSGVRNITATVNVTTGASEATTLDLVIGSPVPDIAAVTGTVTVVAHNSDDVGVTSLHLEVDRAAVEGSHRPNPSEEESIALDTAVIAPGMHVLRAVAKDAAGNEGLSNEVALIVGTQE